MENQVSYIEIVPEGGVFSVYSVIEASFAVPARNWLFRGNMEDCIRTANLVSGSTGIKIRGSGYCNQVLKKLGE